MKKAKPKKYAMGGMPSAAVDSGQQLAQQLASSASQSGLGMAGPRPPGVGMSGMGASPPVNAGAFPSQGLPPRTDMAFIGGGASVPGMGLGRPGMGLGRPMAPGQNMDREKAPGRTEQRRQIEVLRQGMQGSMGNFAPRPRMMKKGGVVKAASKRADGIAQRGKTRGKIV